MWAPISAVRQLASAAIMQLHFSLAYFLAAAFVVAGTPSHSKRLLPRPQWQVLKRYISRRLTAVGCDLLYILKSCACLLFRSKWNHRVRLVPAGYLRQHNQAAVLVSSFRVRSKAFSVNSRLSLPRGPSQALCLDTVASGDKPH